MPDRPSDRADDALAAHLADHLADHLGQVAQWVLRTLGRAFLAAAAVVVLGAVVSVVAGVGWPLGLGGALAPVAFGAVLATAALPRRGRRSGVSGPV